MNIIKILSGEETLDINFDGSIFEERQNFNFEEYKSALNKEIKKRIVENICHI